MDQLEAFYLQLLSTLSDTFNPALIEQLLQSNGYDTELTPDERTAFDALESSTSIIKMCYTRFGFEGIDYYHNVFPDIVDQLQIDYPNVITHLITFFDRQIITKPA